MNEAQSRARFTCSTGCPDRVFEQTIFFAIEFDAFERFRFPAGSQYFDFFIIEKVVQILPGIRAARRSADNSDHLIDVVERDVVTEQNVLACFGLAQFELRAPAHHFNAVFDEQLQQRDQAQFARLAIHDRQQDHAERFLHLRQLEQVIQNDFRFFAALHFDHDAHAIAVGFVAHVGDAFDFLVLHQLGDALDQA